ncbi:hypothetical protein E2C01_070650 [Portunus trituberculatus]|uniref:Uncharacterized protein n=1 Tax=Portunus trituberculatus TaxID=210409 RepID=A0A5B7I1W7_PORTR|nr:hypothetical protein [Portunus trituberculatus]
MTGRGREGGKDQSHGASRITVFEIGGCHRDHRHRTRAYIHLQGRGTTEAAAFWLAQRCPALSRPITARPSSQEKRG